MFIYGLLWTALSYLLPTTNRGTLLSQSACIGQTKGERGGRGLSRVRGGGVSPWGPEGGQRKGIILYRVPEFLSSRLNWDPPTPLPRKRVCLPPEPKLGGDTLACEEGGGGTGQKIYNPFTAVSLQGLDLGSIELFMEDQAFFPLRCRMAPRPPLSPFRRQQVVSFSQTSCVTPVELTDEREGGGGDGGRGAKSYHCEKAWSSINQSL